MCASGLTPRLPVVQAPFCVHPKTGKVCVPIDPAAALYFDPDAVPDVQSLIKNLNDRPRVADQVQYQLACLCNSSEWWCTHCDGKGIVVSQPC